VPRNRVLVIEDEELKRRTVVDALADAGYEVHGTGDGTEGLQLLRDEFWDVALVDLKLPGMDGMTILAKAREVRPETSLVMMTAYGTVQTAVEAMRAGAYDFLTKPFTTDELLMKLDRLFEYRTKSSENAALRQALDSEYKFHSMVGRSRSMRRLFEQICVVADSDATVLVVGETGTGKELVAETIHYSSPRRQGPLVKVSCVTLRESLIESELFGHERGAFSGAIRTRPGRFELAAGGTLFLDEVDDVPISVQPKLLRVLQSHEFERVGGDKTLTANVRVVAATKQDIPRLVSEGRFREDLYYRLNTVTLRLPPLRDRKDEIPILVEHFVRKYDRLEGREFSQGALDVLHRYSWPGNIRELEHVVEAALVMTRERVIEPPHLPHDFLETVSIRSGPLKVALREELAGIERETIVKALAASDGNISHAARHLHIARGTLRDRMKKLGIKAKPSPRP
jgi:DNA-binding NtrC family response regulator